VRTKRKNQIGIREHTANPRENLTLKDKQRESRRVGAREVITFSRGPSLEGSQKGAISGGDRMTTLANSRVVAPPRERGEIVWIIE